MGSTQQAARRLMNQVEYTGECASCGGPVGDGAKLISRAVGAKFTDFNGLITGGGEKICSKCIALMQKAHLSKVVLYHEGVMETGKFDMAWNAMIDPPDGEFVLSVPYSFKKHHLLSAGLSTAEVMNIGTDDGSVEFVTARDAEALGAVVESVKNGVPRAQVMSGQYSPMIMNTFGADYISNLENAVALARETGLLKLIYRVLPKQKKIKYTKEVKRLLSSEDVKAGELLAEIAIRADMRLERGMEFWSAVFPHRVNRFRTLELNDMIERLCQAFSISAVGMSRISNLLNSYSDEEAKSIAHAIRNHTQIVLGICYDTAHLMNERRKKDVK